MAARLQDLEKAAPDIAPKCRGEPLSRNRGKDAVTGIRRDHPCRKILSEVPLIGRLRGFGGAPGYLRQCHGPGWALVGDAGYFKDPLTAHGITDAFRDADLLSRAIVAGGTHALAAYQRERDALSLPFLRITNEIASFTWELDEVKQLHEDLSTAMKAETNHVAGWSQLPSLAA